MFKTAVNGYMLFCKYMKRRTAAEGIFRICFHYIKKDYGPYLNDQHCRIHRESLAAEELCPELSEMTDM
jgi:hypothetical protein